MPGESVPAPTPAPASSPAAPPDWWATFYDDTLAELFLVRADAAELAATVDFLFARLHLSSASTVFDQCCGIGSLSVPLARRVARVVGADLCASYVRRARADAQAAGAACAFFAADAFEFVPERPCDGAFNWWTSFGYAEDDLRNRRMLERARDALRPGGRFLLDYPNVACLLHDFKPCMTRRMTSPADGGEVLLVRESALDLTRGMLDQVWTYLLRDGRRWTRKSSVRLYLPHVLADLLRAAGFVDVEFFGGLRGEPLRPESMRCICGARKP
ncbi:MAG: methyltransferase domain-containing protein [Planctomycetes bacterium]|nr:methyltransferase domain-containing protein [Planctomycetota bacterium]